MIKKYSLFVYHQTVILELVKCVLPVLNLLIIMYNIQASEYKLLQLYSKINKGHVNHFQLVNQ